VSDTPNKGETKMIGIGCESFNPYMLGQNKQVKNIIFYYDGEIKLTINSGWLIDKNGYGRDIKYLDTDEPRRANKVILTKNDNFYIKSEDQSYSFESTYYDLYIYADVEFIEEYVNHTSDNKSRFHYYKKFMVPVVSIMRNGERLETTTVEIFSRIEEHEDLRIKNIQSEILKKSGANISIKSLAMLLEVYKLEEKR
jgi:hypothetical protein